MVRSTDRPAMTIAVDLGRKATKQTNKQTPSLARALIEVVLLSKHKIRKIIFAIIIHRFR